MAEIQLSAVVVSNYNQVPDMFGEFNNNLIKPLLSKNKDNHGLTMAQQLTRIRANYVDYKKYIGKVTTIITYSLVLIRSPHFEASCMLFGYALSHLKKQAIHHLVWIVYKKAKASTFNMPSLKDVLLSDKLKV